MTVQPIALTQPEARRLTERIRTALDRVSSAWSDMAERVAEAYERRADLALGYGSWAEYAEAELQPSEGLAADVRRQLVGMLSAQGMGSRSIAPVVGITDRGVRKSIAAQVGTEFPPDEPESLDALRELTQVGSAEQIDSLTGEVIESGTYPQARRTPWPQRHDEPTAEQRVTGLDGKSYTRPEPRTPRRRAITDQARDAGWGLLKSVERLERIADDDRFTPNKDQVAAHLRGHLQNAIRVCQDLLDRIDSNEGNLS